MNNIGKAFSFVFEDPKWLGKVLVGGLVLLLSIFVLPVPLLVGYLVELRANVIKREGTVLPEWSNVSQKYSKGLILIVGMILYYLVGIILRKTGVPFSGLFSSIYSLIMTFYLPVMTVFFAKEQTFSSMFKVGEILQFVTKNLVALIVFWLLQFVLAIVALTGLIGVIIGVFFTAFYTFAVQAYLYAALYRDRT